MRTKIVLSLIFAVITVNNSDNKFPGFKNYTKDSQNNTNKSQGSTDHADVIKTEIKKYLPQCGVEESEEETHPKRNSTDFTNNSGRYGDNAGQNHGTLGNARSGSGNNNEGGSNPSYGSYGQSYGNSRTGYENWDSRRDRTGYNATSYGNYNGYGTGRTSDPYGSTGRTASRSDYDSYGSRRGDYGYGGSYARAKRSEEDVECVSQCVFGYLEVLDDNRSPSESALIKWFQDHMPNDGKRIKALRDTRRCFGQLSASDNGDGCEFSKSLSNCLNLDIEK